MSALAERTSGRFEAVVEKPRTLSAQERLEALCDSGSLHVIRSTVLPRRQSRRVSPGDGVVGASGTIAGRPVFCYAQDQSFVGGSLGEAHADTIVRVMRLAERAGAPVIGFVASGGARMDDGLGALGGYGRIFRQNVALSGRVPQISVMAGLSAGGGAYSPALTDFVVMTEQSAMFLTGPGIVREVTGEDVDAPGLGGPKVHARNGVCQFVAEDDLDSTRLVRDLLAFLPQRAGEPPPHAPPADPVGGDPAAVVPEAARRVYDIRDVIRRLVDDGELLEVAERWARNMVTAFCRIEGRPVGVIANQPWFLGAVIVLAWPSAEIGIMGPRQAVGIVHRRDIAAADDPEAERDRLADEYADEHLTAEVAASEGFVDELVEPPHTRERLTGALAALSLAGRYGNGPGNI